MKIALINFTIIKAFTKKKKFLIKFDYLNKISIIIREFSTF